MLLRGKEGGGFQISLVCSRLCVGFFSGWKMKWGKNGNAPICPTMLKPVGKSSCSLSGSMALIMSSAPRGNE